MTHANTYLMLVVLLLMATTLFAQNTFNPYQGVAMGNMTLPFTTSNDSNAPVSETMHELLNTTYPEAVIKTKNASLVVDSWYFLTDKKLYLQAVDASKFALEGYFWDAAIKELDAVEFDFANNHIQKRCDKRGNCVGASFQIVANQLIADPIPLFAWGQNAVNGNTVKDAVLDIRNHRDALIINNTVTSLSKVTITSEEDFEGNHISNSTAMITDNAVVNHAHITNTSLTVKGTANCFACNLNSSEVSLAGAANAANILAYDAKVNATGNANLYNSQFHSESDFKASGNVEAIGIQVHQSKVTISGNSKISGSEVRRFSTVTVYDSAYAINMVIVEGNVVEISGSVNAIGIKMYTGAQLFASGNAFIEGMTILNVSQVFVRGNASMSPALICNQSTVSISGNSKAGNAYISSSTIGLTDSAYCQNCWFYSTVDTFGSSLDTSNYTIYHRSQFTHKIHTNAYQLTDGSEANGKVLTSDPKGNATWANITEMVFLLPVHADDAAAFSGGLMPGQLYQTPTGEVRIKL